jgi:hypothetical protein
MVMLDEAQSRSKTEEEYENRAPRKTFQVNFIV